MYFWYTEYQNRITLGHSLPHGVFTIIKPIAAALLIVMLASAGIASEPVSETTVQLAEERIDIPAGSFQMGCNQQLDPRCPKHELPARSIRVAEFAIDRYEVSVAEYRRCVDSAICPAPAGRSYSRFCNWDHRENRENHPVNCVTWFQAEQYCNWKGGRLPTEAEWEKAARGGDARLYPWGNTVPECPHVYIDDKGDGCGNNHTAARGFGAADVSAYGLHDMAGSVAEWVGDKYSKKYLSTINQKAGGVPDKGFQHTVRGGSWTHRKSQARSSNRRGVFSSRRRYEIGFRCAYNQ